EFRFLSDIPAVTPTNGRKIPTHNLVDDLSWLKGTHTIKLGTNIRFARIDRFDNTNSYDSAQINPSWLDGVGKNFAPGNANCNAFCNSLPAVSSQYTAGYADAFPGVLGVLTQATGRFNFDKNGNVLPVGQSVPRTFAYDEYEGYIQDAWQFKAHLTLT